MNKVREFTCENCKETFDKEWSDEESKAEAQAIWGAELGVDDVVICDDCFLKLYNDWKP